MKKIILFTIVATLLFAGCQPTAKTDPVDLDAVKDTISTLADRYTKALISKDLDFLSELMADDGLYCGTDPSEIFDKNALMNYWTEMSKDTLNDYSYQVDLREIRVVADGKSAIVIEHMSADGWSPNMGLTQIYSVVKHDKKWQIDHASWGFLLRNEDVAKVNEALMPEEVVE